MLAVLLLVGFLVFDWTLAIEYEDFDDDSASYSDEATSVDEMPRVRRDYRGTLSPEKINEALKQIMAGRIINDKNEDTSIGIPAFITKIEYYDNPRVTNIDYYESFTPLTRVEYESLPLTHGNSLPAFTSSEYENNPTPFTRSDYENITPMTKLQLDTLITNKYDSLTAQMRSDYNQSIRIRTYKDMAEDLMNKSKEVVADVAPVTKEVYEYDSSTELATMPLNYETISDIPKLPSRTDGLLSNIDAMADDMARKHEEDSFNKSILRDEDDLETHVAYPPTTKPTTLSPTTMSPTTMSPTTMSPTTMSPTTMSPTTMSPTSSKSKTDDDNTLESTTRRFNNSTEQFEDETTTTTKRKITTPRSFDIDKFLEIVANLTYDYYTNLTDQVNETLRRMKIPTCGTPTTTEATTTQFTGPDYHAMSKWLMGKCFVCGLEDPGIPYNAHCADAFAGDFIPLVPIDPTAKGHISSYRKYCRYMDVDGYRYNNTMPLSIFGRWTGGCAVRWTDLSGVYTQRVCRNRYYATTGKHYASKRMAKLEMALQFQDDGCIISPAATLLPLSRGISLFARFHACVCTGSWCNRSSLDSDIDVWTVAVIVMTAVTLS